MPEEQFKYISGIAYPQLFVGENQPRQVKAPVPRESGDRQAYYHDPAIRLSEKDVSSVVGRPICVEHNQKHVVGRIMGAWKGRDNHMHIRARIFVGSDEGKAIYEQIKAGDLSGLSVGYTPVWKGDGRSKEIDYKLFDEISLVERPFFEGASIRVTASKVFQQEREKTSKSPHHHIYFKIMASEQQPQPEQPTQPAAQDAPAQNNNNKDAEELLRHTADMDKFLEENAKRIKELEERAAEAEKMKREYEQLKQEQQKRDDARRLKREKEAEEYAKLNIAHHKELRGEDAPTPEDYIQMLARSFAQKHTDPYTTVQASSSYLAEKYKKENEQLKKEMEEMRSKVTASSAKLQNFQTRTKIAASYKQESPEPEAAPSTNTNTNAGGLSSLFDIRPSKEEMECYGLNDEDVDRIQASAAARRKIKRVEDIPKHQHLGDVGKSMRFNAPGLFAFMVEEDGLNQVRLHNAKISESVVDTQRMGGRSVY